MMVLHPRRLWNVFRGVAYTVFLVVCIVGTVQAQQQSQNGGISPDDATIIRGELIKLRRHIIQQLDEIDRRLRALEAGRSATPPRTAEPSPRTAPPPVKSAPPVRAASPSQKASVPRPPVIRHQPVPDGPAMVCPKGCRYPNLYEAVKAAKNGDTITVAPGLYGMCVNITKSLRLVGLKDENGKRAHLGGGVCAGKGPLVAHAPDIRIEGFEISNVSVRDKNGACVRIDPNVRNITIKDVYCHDSESGIMGHLNNGQVRIEDSVLERNGANNGRAHAIYISKANLLEVINSTVMSSKQGGHSLKSGALKTVVEGSILAALNGRNSRAVDFFSGGELIVRNSIIEQSVNTDNHDAFGIALEPRRLNPEPHSILVEDSWIIFDDLKRCCRSLFNAKQFGPFVVRRNKIIGMTDVGLPGFEAEVKSQNKFFTDRKAAGLPVYDGTLDSLPKISDK